MWWTTQRLESPLALDTETNFVEGDPLSPRRLALVSVCDGKQSLLVHPTKIGEFLEAHKRHTFYLYNAPFDFWVLENHLNGDRLIWEIANANRFLCLQLLWRLIRLAEEGVAERRGTLADAAVVFNTPTIPNKADEYRFRYGELLDLSQREMEAVEGWGGFSSYALNDARTTFELIYRMYSKALKLTYPHRHLIREDAMGKFGPLTVGLQTKAAIVLYHLSRQPLRIDGDAVARMKTDTEEKMRSLVDELERDCPGLWKRPKGKTLFAMEAVLPSRSEKPLQAHLTKLAGEGGIKPLTTAAGAISTSSRAWLAALPKCEWVRKWGEYEALKKRLSFMLDPLAGHSRIFASYEALLNTGRTSAAKHAWLPSIPIQQVPRENDYREIFLADEGCERLTIDYSYLELRTLAACCKWRFGESKLAEAIQRHTKATRRGKKEADPHEVMAAAILGVSVDEYMKLSPAERKAARQRAKAANFGFPGGLGSETFVDYAKMSYGISIQRKEATALKQKWLETYPEMRKWLDDNSIETLAAHLGVSPTVIKSRFSKWNLQHFFNGGLPLEKASAILESLYRLCADKAVRSSLESFRGRLDSGSYKDLRRILFSSFAVTPTGRIRGKVGYCDGANTPFQGLAADGAKLALWRLLFEGMNIKAFIHDEILVDIPPGDDKTRKRIHRIMDTSMEEVLGQEIPCVSESHVGATWLKG